MQCLYGPTESAQMPCIWRFLKRVASKMFL
jgi:hypothetical protein